MENKMETTIDGLGLRDRIWGMWGSYYKKLKATFYLLFSVWGLGMKEILAIRSPQHQDPAAAAAKNKELDQLW